MSVRSSQAIVALFTTRAPSTGAATNADSLPTGTLYVNGVSNAASVTVTNVTTGVYSAAVTLPTLAVLDIVDLRINATVSAVTDNDIIWRDTKDVLLDSSGNTTFNNTTLATVTTVTTLTNLPAITANWLTTTGITDGAFTAAKFASASLNGKGDWNIGKTGYTLTQTFPSNFSSMTITAAGGVKLADAVTHGGTSALLQLGSSTSTPALNITNSGGDAMVVESTADNGSACRMWATGAGFGSGLFVLGGADGGTGLCCFGGDNDGPGISVTTNSHTAGAVLIVNSDGPGIHSVGTTHGFDATLSPDTLTSFFTTDTGTVAGSAVSGSVVKELLDGNMVLADGSITDSTFATPSESGGRHPSVLSMIRRIWEWQTNKRTRDRSTGTLHLRNANDDDNLETQTQSTASTTDTITQGS